LTKSLSCNVAVFTGKEPYYDKFQCHKLQEGYFGVQGRFCVDSNSKKLDPLFPSGRHSKAFGCSLVNNIRPDDVGIPFGLPSMLRSFEQFKVATVRTSWQHVWTLFRVREVFSVLVHLSRRCEKYRRTPVRVRGELGFPLQTWIWEDSCIRPDDRSTLSRRHP
jgi:hypothetical protein